jgi:hypothetical protein
VKTATQSGGDESLVPLPSDVVEQDSISAADMEPYSRTMSPPLIDITKLLQEERQIDILTVQEDRQNVVSHLWISCLVFPILTPDVVLAT